MPTGYLANRHQLMTMADLAFTPLVEEQIARAMTSVRAWWGASLPDLPIDTPQAQLEAVGLVHNLIAQEARVPLFESVFAECLGERFSLWLPTLPGLPHDFHKVAIMGALKALSQTTLHATEAVLTATVKHVHLLAGSYSATGSDGAIPILAAMHTLGVDAYPVHADMVQIGQGAKSRLIRASATEADSAFGLLISENKLLTAQRLRRAGLPAPVTLSAQTPDDAKQAINVIGYPLVVKPEQGNRGECVHVGIFTEQGLQKAVTAAIAHSSNKTALIQPQLSGYCHRIQVLNGKVLWANTRHPKSVVGDGKHSVAELVAMANRKLEHMAVRRRLKPFPLDDLAHSALESQGLTAQSTPAMGVRVNLRLATSVADGGSGISVTDTLHPANAALALDAALACRLDSAGVDFFSEDPTVPWYENGGVILEVNYKAQTFNRPSDRVTSPAQWQFIKTLKAGAARIPIHVFLGQDRAARSAHRKQSLLINEGVKAWTLTEVDLTSPEGYSQPLGAESLAVYIHQLMQHPRLEALCVQVGLWAAQPALPFTHVTSIDTSDIGQYGPIESKWARVVQRLAASMEA